jgi:hypothetical protein
MISSSVNLDRFIVRPLSAVGLYPNLEEFQGLRSSALDLCLPRTRPAVHETLCISPLESAEFSNGRALSVYKSVDRFFDSEDNCAFQWIAGCKSTFSIAQEFRFDSVAQPAPDRR